MDGWMDGWMDGRKEGQISKMSSISCLVAQLTVMLDKSMPVFFNRPFLSQTFPLTLNPVHVVVFSESVFCLRKSIVST